MRGERLVHLDLRPDNLLRQGARRLRIHAVFFSDTTVRLLAHRRGWDVGMAIDR